MIHKRQIGLVVAIIGLFMCIYFRFSLTFIQNELFFEEKRLDMDLVSIEDYTITGSVDRDLFQMILRQTEFFQAAKSKEIGSDGERVVKNDPITKPIKRFEQYLKEVIEATLNKQRYKDRIKKYEKKVQKQKKESKEKQKKKIERVHYKDEKEMNRIVEIQFAFNNRRMLKRLRQYNNELSHLDSIVPGFCSRLFTRRGLRKKVIEETNEI